MDTTDPRKLQSELTGLRERWKNVTSEMGRLEKEKTQIEEKIKNIKASLVVHLEEEKAKIEEKMKGIEGSSDRGAMSLEAESVGEQQRGIGLRGPQEAEPPSKGTVLIVDDTMVARMILRRALGSDGYMVLEAENGTKALDVLKYHCTDLVISDIRMPDMGGLELVRRIRSSAKTAHLPVLMCTASNDESDVVRAARLGIQGFLVKPIAPDVLRAKVRELLPKPYRKGKQSHE